MGEQPKRFISNWTSEELFEIQVQDDFSYESIPRHKKIRMVTRILKNSFPFIIATQAMTIMGIMNVYFLSKANNDALTSGYGFSIGLLNLFTEIFIDGANVSLGILISLANGRREYKLCTVYLQRHSIISGLILFLIVLLLAFSSTIFGSLGVNKDILPFAVLTAQSYIPCLIIVWIYKLFEKFIVSLKSFYPVLYIQLFTLATHFLWSWLFLDFFQLGIIGTACARCIEGIINICIILYYIKTNPKFHLTFVAWKTAYLDWKALISQGIYCITITLTIILDYVIDVIASIIGSTFSLANAAGSVVILSISNLTFSFSFGMSMTSCVYVATCMGQGRPNKASYYAWTGYFIMLICAFIISLSVLCFRQQIAEFWIHDPEIVKFVGDVIILWTFYFFLDAQKVMLEGNLKSAGKQNEVSLGTTIFFYIIGVPLMIYLGVYREMYTIGLWTAIDIVNFLLYIYIFWRFIVIDWVRCTEQLNRTLNESIPAEFANDYMMVSEKEIHVE